ncbi:MAG: membrane protein insertase YidC [Phyllobacteriaceae bacterium]|nr:membrane protein insertase YidC [Phyllobacteriaceae bacterium]
MDNNRNLFLTIAISVIILTLWQVFYMQPRIDAEREAARIEQKAAEAGQGAGNAAQPGETPVAPAQPGAPATPAAPGGAALPASRADALALSKRVKIDTPSLAGSISLTGGRIDDLSLKNYHETVDKTSPIIALLNPGELANGYFAETGYFADPSIGAVPGPSTSWTAEGEQTLTPATPVTLTFVNDKGLTFKRTIAVDGKYMFTVSDTVTNGGATPAVVNAYGRATRFDKPSAAGIWVIHEGMIGVVGDEGLQEVTFSDMEEEKEVKPTKTSEGWLGITDKYWGVALVPSAKTPWQGRFSYLTDGRARYQADFSTDPLTIAPGASETVETLVFAGAKQSAEISAYEDERAIKQFSLLIDWGWFYFITKPMYWLIDTLYKFFGNFGIAILVTTVIVKGLFFPLANKQYASMANMKKMQPAMEEIRAKYADDKMRQQQELLELYKREKINPVAGCWPVLLQIPVFFALYKVLYVTIEMRHAPFFGWIQDLAAPDPTSVFNLFGLLPFGVPAYLMIGVWPLLMGITMFLQMRMNPTPPDPTQAMIFTWMPVMFTFMMAAFPAGLIIYWAWNNLLSIAQQAIIMKRHGAKIELFGNLATLFKKKPEAAK